MEQNYNEVPNIITGKDLDYLSDMFEWNYGALKCTSDAINNVVDEEIKNMLNNANGLFRNNIDSVLQILSEGGNQ